MPKYSNPRREAVFDQWPYGPKTTGYCRFEVETTTKGVRVSRVTTGAKKYTPYQIDALIVDGDDGRTYIVCKPKHGYTFLCVYRSDFLSQETVWPENLAYAELDAMFPKTQPE